MTGYTLINALPEHIEQLCIIGAECGLSPWTTEGYESEMKRRDSIILVAQDSQTRVVGFIVGRADPDVDQQGGASAEIYNIGTRPFIRKAGVGSMLLNRFLEVCRSRRATEVWLEVRASNYEAKSFYSSRGFVKRAVRRNFYSAPVEDAEIMHLQLDQRHSEQICKDA